jgi:hypothetical protein
MNTAADQERIRVLGGPTKLARLLGYARDGGPQRVANWMTRGIPPRVKVERPDLFLCPIDEIRAATTHVAG